MNFRLKQFESAQRDAHKPKAVRINNMQLGIISAINKTNAASRSQTGSHLNQLKAPVQHLAHYRQKAFCLHAMCCAYLRISAPRRVMYLKPMISCLELQWDPVASVPLGPLHFDCYIEGLL